MTLREATPPTGTSSEQWRLNSRLLAQRREAEAAIAADGSRPLTADEIRRLEAQGCRASDWAAVRVASKFTPERIANSSFEGAVWLGVFACCGSGIFDSTISESAIGAGTRVSRCGFVHKYLVAAGAVIEGVDRLGMKGEASDFANSLELFHEELFSRRLRAAAELPFDLAAWATGPEAVADAVARRRLDEINAAADACAAGMKSDRGFVGPGARLRATPVIEDAWIGAGVEIDAALSIREATIWAEEGEPTIIRDGALIRESLIGPGCLVDSQAHIEKSYLVEHVSAQCQAAVKGSCIAANARLSECEVNDSLLGPFVTALHHGLILAAWWPEGKGNIAYGANVGSNHTGRAPDQEIFPGEGVFFGLGSNIKFPSNFREAPFTIIAAGAEALPQRVGFPFSLISPPGERVDSVSPAINEIRPGWALLHNAYGLERQERNHRARSLARRSRVETRILRPDIAEGIRAALKALEGAAAPAGGVFTERELPRLGKNYMTEEARRDGIKAYAFGLKLCAARAVTRLRSGEEACASPDEIRRAAEDLGGADLEAITAAALEVEAEWLGLAAQSKARDAKRGKAILDDYAARHLVGENDPLIREISAELESLRARRAEIARAIERALAV